MSPASGVIIVHEGQDVGRVVLAAVGGVERGALARADEAHRDGGRRARSAARSPAAQASRGRQRARRRPRTGPTERQRCAAARGRGSAPSPVPLVFLRRGVALVGIDDLLHQRVAHHVGAGEVA